MAHPGFGDHEYIIRDRYVPNLGKFWKIWTNMIDYVIPLQSPLKFALVGIFNTLKIMESVNFDKFQILAHYDIIID